MAASNPDITLVVPVYNEEDNLAPLLSEIRAAMARAAGTWELIFVDDGSTDRSLDVIRDLAGKHPEVRYLALDVNRGQSAAFTAGFREARGAVVVTLDADGQNDPADIPAMLDAFGRDGADVVVGWRARRQDTLAKRLASRIGNAIRNRLSRETIRDTGCSLKVMRAEMLRAIPVFNGMHRFFPTLLRLQGAVVTEVAVNHRPRVSGVSKYGIWDRARTTAFDLLAVRWLQNRHVSYTVRERKD